MITALLVLIYAQPASAQEYPFRTYGEADGLKNQPVFCMEQDIDGTLWFCTVSSMFHFNGHTFQGVKGSTLSDIPNLYITALKIGTDGEMWLGTGANLYYGRGGALRSLFEMKVDNGNTIVPLGGKALAISEGKLLRISRHGNVWVQEPYFTPDALKKTPELGQLRGMMLTDGKIVAGCGYRLCQIDGDKVWISANLAPDIWTAFLRSRNGSIWARGRNHVAELPRGKEWEPRDNDAALLHALDATASLAEDHDGNILIFYGDTVASWDGKRWTEFPPGQDRGYPVDLVKADRNGEIWISRSGVGIQRWVGFGMAEQWTRSTGLASNLVFAIHRDLKKRVWIGGVGGIDVLQNGQVVRSFRSPDAQQTRSIAMTADGIMWAGTAAGLLLRVDKNDGMRVALRGLQHVTSIFVDSRDRMWLCTWSGLYLYDPKTGTAMEHVLPEMTVSHSVYGANEDAQHNLWFMANPGLIRLSPDGLWERAKLQEKDVIPSEFAAAFTPDGALWTTGQHGRLHRLSMRGNRVESVEEKNAATTAPIEYFLARDKGGRLWIGKSDGADIYDGHRWTHVTEEDGLVGNDCDAYAFFADDDGSMWIGTSKGVTHFTHPEKLFRDESRHARVLGGSFAGQPLEDTGSAHFPWQKGALELRLGVSEDPSPYNLEFHYRLKGFEEEWQTTHERQVRYAGLQPGRYQFELVAENTGRGLQSKSADFELTLRPPWWRSWWAYLVLAGLAIIAVAAAWLWRTALLRARQRELEAMVEHRTRELRAEKLELIAAREALREKAERDALTRLWNRQTILDILEREIERARRSGTPLTIVLADIDYFKRINDSYGHLVGDEVLKSVAERIQGWVRPYDFIGRVGGEELLMIFPGLSLEPTCERLEYLREHINHDPYPVDDEPIYVTCSFGVAEVKPDMTQRAVLLAADGALYRAKDEGRNCIRFAEVGD